MSGYLGDFTTSNTVYVPFNTFDSNDPSASVIVSAFVVGDIAIYKNGSVTQRTSTAGFTLLDTDGINFDGHVGIHGFSIDLSDNTDAGFYAAGGEYFIVVGPVTVDAATINFIAGTFSIERTGGALALIKARLPSALVGGRMDADVGAKTGNVALSTQEKLDVNAEADTALTDYDAPTKAEMDTAHALLATPAQVATELGTYDGPTRAEATIDKDEIVTDLDDVKGTSFVKDTHSLIDLKTESALIVGDTNELQGDWVNTGRLDTILDAIKAVIDKFVFTVANILDVNVLRINGNANSPVILDRAVRSTTRFTIGAASSATNIITSSMDPAAVVIDQFKGLVLKFDKDTTTTNLRGQGTDITGNTAAGVLTVTALTTAPVSGDQGVIE